MQQNPKPSTNFALACCTTMDKHRTFALKRRLLNRAIKKISTKFSFNTLSEMQNVLNVQGVVEL